MYLMCNSKAVTKAAWGDDLPSPWQLVSGQAAYWRKANQIHLWFVNHVQSGEDDCGTYDVSVDQLKELLGTVEEVLSSTKLVDGKVSAGYRVKDGDFEEQFVDGKVLEDDRVARRLLPTTSGFFFGDTHYDQYYWDDLVYTRDQLKRILGSIELVEYEAFGDASDFKFKDWMAKGDRDWEVRFQYHSSW